jgi:hypothetical protein
MIKAARSADVVLQRSIVLDMVRKYRTRVCLLEGREEYFIQLVSELDKLVEMAESCAMARCAESHGR